MEDARFHSSGGVSVLMPLKQRWNFYYIDLLLF